MKKTTLGGAVALIISAVMTTPASAINSLQLGPDGSSDWTYVGGGDDTWYYNGTQPFTLNAYANATKDDGGNGDYAWATEPDLDRYAYLVAATVPDLGDIGDLFDLTISNATPVTSGYGRPPVEDPNSLSSHGIFDTYFEIYEFQFDSGIVDISDTKPGEAGTGKGYKEAFSISWSDLTAGGDVEGVHFDLFTVDSGRYEAGGPTNKNLVEAFAPYSHDAQSTRPPTGDDPPAVIPEPSILALFGISMFGLGLLRRRQKNG
jgi:hypothetical protein